jgi:hypothetical protein
MTISFLGGIAFDLLVNANKGPERGRGSRSGVKVSG